LPPDTLTPQEIYLPEALAAQLDAYVRWLAAKHHLPEQVVLILAFERATREFLRTDRLWAAHRQSQ
jgi:hypothetical protein